MEIWKNIENYEENYEVSNYGRIRSKDRIIKTKIKNNNTRLIKGKVLKLNQKRNGYLAVDLSKNGKVKTILVHRLVAQAFILNNDNTKNEVNHKNAIKTDNRAENLEWVTREENKTHALNNHLYKNNHKQKIRCNQLNIVFNSSYDAAEFINKNKFQYSKKTKSIANKIRACANNLQKSAYGYTWEKLYKSFND